jgi:hypothetical protein
MIVIEILVMHRQLAEPLALKLTTTAPADMRKQLEGPHPVPRLPGFHLTP